MQSFNEHKRAKCLCGCVNSSICYVLLFIFTLQKRCSFYLKAHSLLVIYTQKHLKCIRCCWCNVKAIWWRRKKNMSPIPHSHFFVHGCLSCEHKRNSMNSNRQYIQSTSSQGFRMVKIVTDKWLLQAITFSHIQPKLCAKWMWMQQISFRYDLTDQRIRVCVCVTMTFCQ